MQNIPFHLKEKLIPGYFLVESTWINSIKLHPEKQLVGRLQSLHLSDNTLIKIKPMPLFSIINKAKTKIIFLQQIKGFANFIKDCLTLYVSLYSQTNKEELIINLYIWTVNSSTKPKNTTFQDNTGYNPLLLHKPAKSTRLSYIQHVTVGKNQLDVAYYLSFEGVSSCIN